MNFTSSYFSTPIAASLALSATPSSWRTIFKYRKANSRQKRSPTLGRQSPSTLLRSGRFRHCRALGLYQASSTTWRPDLSRSWYRQRRFVLRKTPDSRPYIDWSGQLSSGRQPEVIDRPRGHVLVCRAGSDGRRNTCLEFAELSGFCWTENPAGTAADRKIAIHLKGVGSCLYDLRR